MAHDNEARLIGAVIRERNLRPLMEAGVKNDWWQNPECKVVYRWVVKHYNQYGEVPTVVSVKDEFPTFTVLHVEDSVQYLLDRFIAYRRYVHVEDMLQDAAEILSRTNDHEAALNTVERSLTQIHQEGTPNTSDLVLSKDPESRFTEYEENEKRAGSLLGLTTGFQKIDEATGGLQGGQLTTLIASPKVGKSMALLQMAINMHIDGANVLFTTFEMTTKETQDRHDAMRSHVSYNRMRRRVLTIPEKNDYQDMLADMATRSNDLVLSDSITGITVSALAAKIEQHKPQVVFIDGVYLMIDEQSGESNTPAALTNLTRSLKRLAQRLNIPIVISTQTLLWKMKGKKVAADSIGYSSSFFQDSDVILGLEEDENDPEARMLKIVASRNCGPEEALLVWRWDTGCFHDEFITNCSGCSAASLLAPLVPVT